MRKKISLEKAIEKCAELVRTIDDVEIIPVEHAYNRVVAQDLRALVDMPPFDTARMDGYTVGIDDLAKLERLSNEDSLSLKIVANLPAGSSGSIFPLVGQTVRIMTGALLPQGTAAIVKQEEVVREDESWVRVFGSVDYHNHIQKRGSVINKGELLVRAGEMLDYNNLERLAATGNARLPVYRQPVVYIINSGSELVLPGVPLSTGKIYNSNRSLFFAKLAREQCTVKTGPCPVLDKREEICAEISHGLKVADMVIITGGAADGDYDLVPSALAEIGAEFIYHGLLMQPGAKSSAAVKDGKLIINLPGNPWAGDILFEVLIVPVLNKVKGMKNWCTRWFEITLEGDNLEPTDLRRMCRGELRAGHDVSLVAGYLEKNQPCTGIRPLILDIQPGQGHEGDIIRALLI
ncbi:MAG: molybdopterin molybdotransferase MoeA [Syntrophomonadaceae bacterium]|jgi:molybdopterin molybdotransferase